MPVLHVVTALSALVLLFAVSAFGQAAEEWVGRGDRHMQHEEYNTAVTCYTKAVGIDPHNAAACFKRALAYEALGELEPAIADITTAIGLDPANYEYYSVRGFLYNVERKYYLAVVDLDRSIALKPGAGDNGRAYLDRATAYHNLGGYDLAVADYTAYIGANPDDGEAHWLRGKAYRDSGDIEDAKKDYKKACDLGLTAACDEYETLK